ncbi:MAG: MFS transporter [Nitriliruptoraceae bacterium]|nr:MFS transporter [Nitriliruptoraceae bacterium]
MTTDPSPDARDRDDVLERAYAALIDDEDHGRGDLPDRVDAAVPGNAGKQVVALTLQKAGDLVVDAKTVLAWLLAALGAPASFTGLLVPIRESGSMLPQAVLVPLVRRLAVRKWVWVAGGLLQAMAVVAMAVIAATLEGTAAGVAILAALTVFALARSLSSIASKDVLGRTVPKGARGQINGYATIGSGAAAITVGLGMRLLGGEDTDPVTFAWLFAGAAVAWVLASAAFATVTEEPGEHDDDADGGAIRSAIGLLREDAPFRRFVIVRTLLLVSALTPPFVVTLATEEGGAGLEGLGGFVISSGLASLIGGRFWGRFADRSSRRTMMLAAGLASGVILALLALLLVDDLRELTLLYPAAYLLLALAHTGVRLGRKTYVVDLAEGNRRTDYVAVSNTAMGLLLLFTGAVTSAIAVAGVEVALLALALLGLAGVVMGRTLPEVSAGED